ncbi:uncharacterized protein PADG_12371 [Paracoccidioides brasiliensis Pb18]|uniref:Uncharacterized protein n=1 Tax=Paracoccidioides brasiliensis (strain Pb18) TaxID=502780 RepID=A0A0A0HT76_PARBD|nr:uncharacterized protein PADG_12371 [Paracoccidioides brasiliensis Pb18]KGM91513.1 hypothetical protein PADG_12371 [Paracoccidioides brasiliensis Pb18]
MVAPVCLVLSRDGVGQENLRLWAAAVGSTNTERTGSWKNVETIHLRYVNAHQMWLDRFSAHPPAASGASTPSSRPYSPARRNPLLAAASSHPVHPAFSPRSSSLSLATSPNVSTSSIPATLRQANGSSSLPRQDGSKLDSMSQQQQQQQQRQQQQQQQQQQDPLEVLCNILGKQQIAGDMQTVSVVKAAVAKPECLVEDIEFGELSLEEFVQQGKSGGDKTSKGRGDVQTLEQYEKERDRFQDLHGAIAGCDDVLKSVESYLSRFQTELGVVSAEIESLQSRSVQLNSQLENRLNLERLLGPAVEEVSISPKAVRLISGGPINQEWVKALNEVETRSASIEANTSTLANVKAVEDLKPLLSDLKAKAIERVRDYLVAQIKAIRSPNMNAQVIQQKSLVKYKDLYAFLARNHPTLAEEIVQAYINTLKWYYLSNFTRYTQALEKLKLHAADRNDLLGGDPNAQKRANAYHSTTYDPFSLGRRLDILRSANPTALPSYLAEDPQQPTKQTIHGIEVPFHNFNLALIDNISAEYSFVTEMFAPALPPSHSHSHSHSHSRASASTQTARLHQIFNPVFTLGQTQTKTLLDRSTDCLGILLCVRLNQHFAFELQRRKVPVADGYINQINMLLWPRFQMVMDMHTESLKRFAAGINTIAGAAASGAAHNIAALALTSGGDRQSSSSSSAPHPLTQRFGQFLQGILALSSEAGDDEPVSNSLARLRGEFDVLLGKFGRAGNGGDARGRERFLWSNYSLVMTIINDTHGKLASEQKEVSFEFLFHHGRPSFPYCDLATMGGLLYLLTFWIWQVRFHCYTVRATSIFVRIISIIIEQVIIGGGIVGLSIARHLAAARPNTTTVLLERHAHLGTETTSRNSEVIHAGLYYPRASLKTSLCIRGNHLLYSLCASRNIPHSNTSKWILAQDDEQMHTLQQLHEHSRQIRVPTRFVGSAEARRAEPDVRARAGVLESASTGIVDSHALMGCLRGEFEEMGGDVALLTAVEGVEKLPAGGGYVIYTRSGGGGGGGGGGEKGQGGEEWAVTAETLINAAGHSSCAISNMLLPRHRHVTPAYAKGTYFSYAASSPKPRRLLYPAPKAGLGGLGTHLTLDMAGQVRFGPDVEWVDGPEDLVPNTGRLEEAVREIREYLPGVKAEMIRLDYCGVRPKLAVGEGEERGAFRDFVIREEEGFEGFVNLLGIESPGLTSALAIGERVEELLYG